ncbi:MAG TPA: anti-sigma factor [Candidatus Ozemobacteraceae bacterium]
MTCEREELLSRYIDGDLGAQETAEMRRHIATCRECQGVYHETTRREKAVRDTLSAVVSSMPLREKVMQRIAAERLSPECLREAARPAGRRAPMLAWALAVVIVVAVSTMLYLTTMKPPQGRSSADMIAIMGLQDGSAVGRKTLSQRGTCFAPPGFATPMQGSLALFLHGTKRKPALFIGSATMQLDFNRITWMEGEGDIVTAANHDIVVRIGEDELLLKTASLHLKGAAASYQATLATGTAYRFRNNRAEALALASPTATTTGLLPAREQASTVEHPETSEHPPASSEYLSPQTGQDPAPAAPAHPVPTANPASQAASTQTASSAAGTQGETVEPVRNPFVVPQINGTVGE